MQSQSQLKMKVIVVTSHTNLEKMTAAYRLGAQTFLTKPLMEDEVRSLIRRLNRVQNN
jgi:DNA-binding NtrC family response regulator